jgi:hypothetical protein
MSWTYEIPTGRLFDPSGLLLSTGYSGHGLGLNNIEMQDVEDVGPIPVGWYTRGEPINSPKHGPEAIPLIPDPDNVMFNRVDFFEHGDEIAHPGQHLASLGCIIMAEFSRHQQIASPDKRLQVVAAMTPTTVVSDIGIGT